MRRCIIRGCGRPLPTKTFRARDGSFFEATIAGVQYENSLCDVHYAPVSDAAIARYIDRQLARQAILEMLRSRLAVTKRTAPNAV